MYAPELFGTDLEGTQSWKVNAKEERQIRDELNLTKIAT